MSEAEDYGTEDARPLRAVAEDLEDGRTLPGATTRVTLADGTDLTVRITNRDYVAWDRTAPRKKWGKASDVPFLAATFMAWSAARREQLTALPFDQTGVPNWVDAVEDIDSRQDEEDGPDAARPTRKAPGAAS